MAMKELVVSIGVMDPIFYSVGSFEEDKKDVVIVGVPSS